MKSKSKRKLKVYNQSSNGKYNVPAIILKGEWLKQLGFDIATPIIVTCENDKLIISLQQEN